MTDAPSIVVFMPAHVRITRSPPMAGTSRAASATLPRSDAATTSGGVSGPRPRAGQPPPITIWPDPNCLSVIDRSACWTGGSITTRPGSVMFMCSGSAAVGKRTPRPAHDLARAPGGGDDRPDRQR